MKFVLIVFLFDILIDRKGYMAILALFQFVFAISLTNISNMKSSLALNYLRIILLRELLMPDWLPFAISVSAGIFGASILIGRFLKNPEESTNNVLKGYQLVSLEIFILILYGLLELQKPSNNIIAFAIRRVKRLLLGAWMNLHLWLEVGRGVMSIGLALILAVIFAVADWVGEMISYLVYPEDSRPKWLINPLRRLLSSTITIAITTLLGSLVASYFIGATSFLIGFVIELFKSVMKTVVKRIMVSLISSVLHLIDVPQWKF